MGYYEDVFMFARGLVKKIDVQTFIRVTSHAGSTSLSQMRVSSRDTTQAYSSTHFLVSHIASEEVQSISYLYS